MLIFKILFPYKENQTTLNPILIQPNRQPVPGKLRELLQRPQIRRTLSQIRPANHPNLNRLRQSREAQKREYGMCKQHWERVMELVRENRFPKNVNLLEVRAYMYACYLERKISIEEWNQFESGVYNLDPTLLLVS
jgi:hypothetical protein